VQTLNLCNLTPANRPSIKNIGLDDIRLLDSCPKTTSKSCDFETLDLCGYSTDALKNSWKRASAMSLPQGPPNDQYYIDFRKLFIGFRVKIVYFSSTGSKTGSFMYVDGAQKTKVLWSLIMFYTYSNHVAILVESGFFKMTLKSPTVQSTSEQCLEFYYYQRPTDATNTLTVSIEYDGGKSVIPVWYQQYSKNDINDWQIVQIPIGNDESSPPYRVLFEANQNGRKTKFIETGFFH
jgi:hypothetical protein